jgi:hypothetical protein
MYAKDYVKGGSAVPSQNVLLRERGGKVAAYEHYMVAEIQKE